LLCFDDEIVFGRLRQEDLRPQVGHGHHFAILSISSPSPNNISTSATHHALGKANFSIESTTVGLAAKISQRFSNLMSSHCRLCRPNGGTR
jgi:hypothetical protein